MKKIWQWKKTIIFAALLVIIAILSLSLLAFLPREVRADDNNPDYCYYTDIILTQDTPHKNYPNVYLMATLAGDINEVNVMYNGIQYYTTQNRHEDMEIVRVGGFETGKVDYKGIEIYYMLNTTSPKVLECCPEVTVKMEGNIAKAAFQTKELSTFQRANISLKIIVKVI